MPCTPHLCSDEPVCDFLVLSFSHQVVFDSCNPKDGSPSGSSVYGILQARTGFPGGIPGKNPGMSCHFLLQGIFPTQVESTTEFSLTTYQCLFNEGFRSNSEDS